MQELKLNGCESDVPAKNQIVQVRGHQQCHLCQMALMLPSCHAQCLTKHLAQEERSS